MHMHTYYAYYSTTSSSIHRLYELIISTITSMHTSYS